MAIHYDRFLVANIGPRGNSEIKPIGHSIHIVSKIQEKAIGGDIVFTKDAVDRLDYNAIFDNRRLNNSRYQNILFSFRLPLKIGKKVYFLFKWNSDAFFKLLRWDDQLRKNKK